MSDSGETNVGYQDETDGNNVRDDSTLLSKARMRMPFARPN